MGRDSFDPVGNFGSVRLHDVPRTDPSIVPTDLANADLANADLADSAQA